jgi:putative tricarboxylic transport membrane protein
VAAGGSVDLYARGIKNALETLNLVNGQTVVTDNKPGAGGLLALQQLQRSRGNAHNLGTFHTGSLAGQVTGILKADMREFVPVAMLVEETTLVAVRADSPLKTAKDLVAALKRDPTLHQDRRGAAEGPEHAPGHRQAAEGGRHRHHQADRRAVPLVGGLDERAAGRPCGRGLRHRPHRGADGSGRQGAHPGQRRPGARHRPAGRRAHLARAGRGRRLRELQRRAAAPGVDAEQIRFWEQALKQVAASKDWIALVEKSGNKPMFKGYVDSHRYLQDELKATQALVAELGLDAK